MTVIDAMDPVSLLALVALAWVLLAGVLGLMQGVKHTQYMATLDGYAARGDLSGYHRAFTDFRRSTNTHTHAMLFALLSLAIALMLRQEGIGDEGAGVISLLLIAAMIVWTAGGVLDAKVMKGAGDLMLLSGICFTLLCSLGILS